MTGGVNLNATGDVTIFGDVVGGDKIVIHNPPPLPPREREHRRGLGLLLKAVRTFWVDGVLADSVHHAVLLALGKELRPEAIQHPWDSVLEQPHRRQPVPRDARLAELFEQTGRALLILGEPGSGKTVTLLELARDLLDQAEQDPDFNRPVPVVFNLASWTERQPLLDWLAAELAAKYHVPQRIGKPWLEQHRLLPLLDGLDEVRAESRAACVAAINTFAQTVGFAGLAVCSRLAEYTSLPERLRLQAAIVLQPLSSEQVEHYLANAGPDQQRLSAALREDPALVKLAETPLILSILALVYRDLAPAAAPAATTLEARRAWLFEAYVERMFQRRGQAARAYAPEQTRRWLSWLARRMLEHGHSIFMIEQLQPSWLGRRERLAYVLLTRLAAGGLVGAVLLAAVSLAITQDFTRAGRDPLLLGGASLVTCLVTALLLTVLDAATLELRPTPPKPAFWRSLGSSLGLSLLLGVVFGAHGLALGWLQPRAIPAGVGPLPDGFEPILTLLVALFLGCAFGLLGGGTMGALFGARGARLSRASDIRIAEALSWDWRRAWLGAGLGLLVGLTASVLVAALISPVAFLALIPADRAAFILEIVVALLGTLLMSILIISLGIGPMFGALGLVGGGLFAGLRRRVLDRSPRPNLGLRLLARNALIAAVTFAGVGVLPFGLGVAFSRVSGAGALAAAMAMSAADPSQVLASAWQAARQTLPTIRVSDVLAAGLTLSLPTALLAAFWYGGLDVINHYSLRLLLWLSQHAPRHFAHFLDYAAERIFLRKVGGGYIFIHRFLLEHFARAHAD